MFDPSHNIINKKKNVKSISAIHAAVLESVKELFMKCVPHVKAIIP